MHGRSACCLLVALALCASSLVAGQSVRPQRVVPEFELKRSPEIPSRPITRPPRGPALPSGGFANVMRAAGMIFSGTITKIERRPAHLGQPVEAVAVTFHVEKAIRGAVAGESLTITQWVGVWSSGQRYRVGERLLLFLYPESKLGLTSCVGGPLGRFSFDAAGRVLLSAQHVAAFRKDPVLGGKSRVPFSDFALAVRHADEEETQ